MGFYLEFLGGQYEEIKHDWVYKFEDFVADIGGYLVQTSLIQFSTSKI